MFNSQSSHPGLVGMGFVGISHVHRTFLRDLNEFLVGEMGDERGNKQLTYPLVI
jgi:hypothetical protein